MLSIYYELKSICLYPCIFRPAGISYLVPWAIIKFKYIYKLNIWNTQTCKWWSSKVSTVYKIIKAYIMYYPECIAGFGSNPDESNCLVQVRQSKIYNSLLGLKRVKSTHMNSELGCINKERYKWLHTCYWLCRSESGR